MLQSLRGGWVGLVAMIAVVCVAGPGVARADTDTVVNPMNLPYQDALVRLKVEVPDGDARQRLVVRLGGQVVPHQFDEQGALWVAVSLEPGQSATFRVTAEGQAGSAAKPADEQAYDAAVSAKVRELVGGAEPSARGPLYRRWLITRDDGSRIRVTQQPGKPFAVVEEDGATTWTLPLSPGGTGAARGLIRRWYAAPFNAAPAVEEVALDNSVTRIEGAMIYLQPRWTQSYDDAWFFGVRDDAGMVGVLPLRAGRWRWMRDAKLTVRADGQGGAVLDGAMGRGARMWLLIAGPAALAERVPGLARSEGFAPLDKLHHGYVFAPLRDGDRTIGVQDFYSNQTNPTDMIRRWSRSAMADVAAGKTRADNALAYEVQARFDPDWYGRYEHGHSPINPNFFSDFMKLAILQAALLDRSHPAFTRVRDEAETVMRSDMEHAVTLPGGAGQECPGYQAHAAEQWAALRPITRDRLGFDPASWPQWEATGRFILHSSQPIGGGRRAFHPGGDTHPARPDPAAFAKRFGYTADARRFTPEELPGFGVIFRDRPGTNQETYMAFKAGPNRGHYHGDQLSFHMGFASRPAAIDHWVSYSPRAGQEHMHNRLSFAHPDLPWATMDGHERLIAFQTGESVDIAVGQVESPRLRQTTRLPPEEWDTRSPKIDFDTPLVYRRTIVHVRGGPADYFVIRDQYQGPPLDVTYNLHVLSEKMDRRGDTIAFDPLTLFIAKPAQFDFESFPYEHDRNGGESTQGARLTVRSDSAQFITVLYPAGHQPRFEAIDNGVRITRGSVADEVRFDGGLIDGSMAFDGRVPACVVVQRDGKPLASLGPEQIDLDRSQGQIGLFVPDVGYPFGPIPDWLIEQRATIEPLDW